MVKRRIGIGARGDRWMGIGGERKDGEWGPTKVLENGTVIAAGIVSSVTSGFADMCVAR